MRIKSFQTLSWHKRLNSTTWVQPLSFKFAYPNGSQINLGHLNRWITANMTTKELEAMRMTVNQITFAILISVLVVANMLLVWSLAYIVMSYERRGRLTLKRYHTITAINRRKSSSSSSQ